MQVVCAYLQACLQLQTEDGTRWNMELKVPSTLHVILTAII